jgi:hypothetical protein
MGLGGKFLDACLDTYQVWRVAAIVSKSVLIPHHLPVVDNCTPTAAGINRISGVSYSDSTPGVT